MALRCRNQQAGQTPAASFASKQVYDREVPMTGKKTASILRSVAARWLFALSLVSGALSAAVVRVDIQSRTDVLEGRPFGLAGAYEKVAGKVYFAVDPSNSINQIIADLDKAPKNPQGKVEFSADLYVLRPKQAEKGNGAVLFEVSNRGGKGMLGMYNHAKASLDPSAPADFGDGFLMRQGYTLVWLGWQVDMPMNPGLVRLYPPKALGVKGLVRSEIIVSQRSDSHSLADRDHIAYAIADPNDPKAVMTVHDKPDSPRKTIPRSQWRFSTDRGHVELTGGFEPNKIYEVVYTSEDPAVIGLGPAGIRDFLSYVKYDPASPIKNIHREIAFGVSQSGRFLRTYLYYGFNQDESGRQVFDGVLAHVGGGGRGSFNIRFGQASRDGHPYLNTFYPTDIFPFTDLDETDPATGLTDGLLDRAQKTHTAPHIFYTNSSYEYWGRAASLIHMAPDGKSDAKIPDNVRIYMFAGGQHGPAAFPPQRSIGQQLNNPNDYRWAMRALLTAMDRWVGEGSPPPASVYPQIGRDTLVSPQAVQFPKIPGVSFPGIVHKAYRLDYGPDFKAGIISFEPPKLTGAPFPILVSQVDLDGNETGGLKMPEVAVPLATYTGWNLFDGKAGPADELSSMQGSFIPFPRTRADRERTHDPRRSIEERYYDRNEYLGEVSDAAMRLMEQGYLLEGDLRSILDQANARWKHATGQ